MRHQNLSQRLKRPVGKRQALFRSLAIGLLRSERIKTTAAKAHSLRAFIEQLIRLGKQNTLQSRRHALKILHNKEAVKRLFAQIAPLFKNRISGFTRIIRLANPRKGDGASLVLFELTEKLPKKEKPKKEERSKPISKPAPEAKAKPEIKAEEKERAKFTKEESKPAKQAKPKKFLGGLRRLFKGERDSL